MDAAAVRNGGRIGFSVIESNAAAFKRFNK